MSVSDSSVPTPLNHEAVLEMENAGYTVLIDQLSNGAYRVRVQRRTGRRYLYNAHTSATSSVETALRRAHEKWKAHRFDLKGIPG